MFTGFTNGKKPVLLIMKRLILSFGILSGIVIGMVISGCATPASGDENATSGIYTKWYPEYQTMCFAVQRHYSGVAIALDCIEWPRE